MANDYLFDLQSLCRLQTLCKLGARPPIILSLLPTLPDAFVKDVWTSVQSKRPPKGPLPHERAHFFATPRRRLHSSLFLSAWISMRSSKGCHDVDALTSAYRFYLERLGQDAEEEPLSFDRMWFLTREYRRKAIVMIRCATCGAAYIHVPDDLIDDRYCPVNQLASHPIFRRKAESPATRKKPLGPTVGINTANFSGFNLGNRIPNNGMITACHTESSKKS